MRHDAPQRNHRRLRTAAADVHDHVPRCLRNRDFGANGSREWLFDEICHARACRKGGIQYCPALHLRDPGGHTNHNFRLKKAVASGDAVDKIGKKGFGDAIIGNHAIAHGTRRHDVAGSTAQHFFSFIAYGYHPSVIYRHGHHGGLVEHYAHTRQPNKRISRA